MRTRYGFIASLDRVFELALMAEQGLALSSPYINNDTALKDQVTAITPSIQSYPDVLDTITRDLYPPEFDGSQSYTDQVARAALFIGDE